jgi:hypothetical protein
VGAARYFCAVNVLVLAAMALYVKIKGLPPGRFKIALRKILYGIDQAADEMEMPVKRTKAISQFQQLVFWPTINRWRIYPPAAFIEWIIDAAVAVISRIQAVTGIENFHQRETPAAPAVQNDNLGREHKCELR